VKRVLVITPAIDGADGISTLGRLVVSALARAVGDNNLDVWALDGGRPAAVPPSVAFWSAAGARTRIISRALAAAARGCSDLDVVVLHLHLAPLAHVMKGRGARVTTFLIGIESWTPLRARERRALAAADRLLAISDFTIREFRAANPALADRPVTKCAPGISAAAAAPVGAGESGFGLIVGRLSSAERYKGHDALIDIWPSVREAVPDARLVIAGDGDDRERLETAVRDRGLRQAIVFTGRLDDAALVDWYARAAFFVMPSAREGFGLVYLEAMRAGKPCIAAHGAADEIIRQGIDGLIVDAGSRDDLAAAVVRLFSNSEERTRMGAAARARVNTYFAEDQFAARLLRAVDLPVPPAAAVEQEALS
jgi:glycosyltransferase involved in cell wall biosynthesis